MAWKERIIWIVVVVALAGGCFGIWKFYHNPQVVYEWKGKTSETVYVENGDKSNKCFMSPIWIEGEKVKDGFLVKAGDDYKYATRTLKATTPIYRHIPIITYSPLYDIESREVNRHKLDGMYFYNFGPVALGGGVSSIFSKSKLYDIGPTIGIAGFFE